MDSDLHALLSRLPGCAHLDESARAALAAGSRAEQWPAGARILIEGDPAPDWVAIVESGAIRVSGSGLEGEAPADSLGPGDLLDPGMPAMTGAGAFMSMPSTRESRGALSFDALLDMTLPRHRNLAFMSL